MIKDKVFFITGGAGFIATNFISSVIDNNEVIAYDNLHRNAMQFCGFRDHLNFAFIKGDILDEESLRKSIPEKCDYVIHCAAIAGVGVVVRHPFTTLNINMIGTYKVLQAVKDKKIKRFIDFSTSEVYGPHVFRACESEATTQGPIGEPRWVYAASKLASEYLTHGYYVEYGLPACSIRPFNIYGPGQVGEGAIHHFVMAALQGKDICVHGDGNQIRSWCYISDMVNAINMICENDSAVGGVFNIGNPKETVTVLDLARKIVALTKTSSKIIFKKIDYPDVEIRVPSIENARQRLSYEPEVNIEEGLKRTVAWYKEINNFR